MAIMLLYAGQTPQQVQAEADGDNLWLSLSELQKTTGWELKPEGACLGDVCVPIPPGREAEFLRSDKTEFNLASLAQLQRQPVVRSDKHATSFFGEQSTMRGDVLTSLQAPDFILPDLDGKEHSLSDHRGKKVLLFS